MANGNDSQDSVTKQPKAKEFMGYDAFEAFKMRELQYSMIKNYALTFGSFAKAPS